jgi:hypothetical protein
MERLTLEEAINHEKMMAQRKKWNDKFTKISLENEEINKRFEADCIKDAEEHEQFAEWLEELKLYKDIGTLKELKGLKENGTFTGLELAKLAIMQKELKKYEDLEEQGLLVRLPCKEAYSRSGDFVYLIYYYEIIECVHCGLRIDPLSGKAYITLATDEKLFPYRSPDPEQDLDPTDWCTNATDVEISELGKTIFLTHEKAKKKLEEIQNDKT